MKIAIIGLGYVGLPLAVEFAIKGHSVLGIDVDEVRVHQINQGLNYIGDVDDQVLSNVVTNGLLSASTSFEGVSAVHAVFICVPTPISQHKDPDLGAVRSASTALARHLKKGQTIVLKSTTFPTTTEEVVLPILESGSDLKVGEDFSLAYSPERVDPGNDEWTTANTPVVVGGVTDHCTTKAMEIISLVTPHVKTVSSPRVAELEKLLENIFRSVNIALVNELALLCDRTGGVSIWEVVDAAATKPFGFMPFFPGPGLGGHCIPIDPHYLSWYARKFDFETSFITLSAKVNEEMPFHVLHGVQSILAEQGTIGSTARVLILGASFKKNVNDVRHSPALKIIELIESHTSADVFFCDPHVPVLKRDWDADQGSMNSIELTESTLSSYDIAILVTDHDAFDYNMIASHCRNIVDTRNAFKSRNLASSNISVIGCGSFLKQQTADSVRSTVDQPAQ